MPRGLRDTGAYALGYRAQATRLSAARHRPVPELRPARAARGARAAAAAPGAARGRRARPAPLAPDRVLPAAAARSRSSSGRTSGGSSRCLAVIVQWFVTLFRGRPIGVVPPVRRARTSGTRSTSRRSASLAANPFPGFTGKPGQLPARPRPARARSGRTAGRRSSAAFLVDPGGDPVDRAPRRRSSSRRSSPGSRRSSPAGRPRGSATSPPGPCATSARRTRTSTSSPTSTRTRARSRAPSPSRRAGAARRRPSSCRRRERPPRGDRCRRSPCSPAIWAVVGLPALADDGAVVAPAAARGHAALFPARRAAPRRLRYDHVASAPRRPRASARGRRLRRLLAGGAAGSSASRPPGRSARGCCSGCSASGCSGSPRSRSRCSRSGGTAATTSATRATGTPSSAAGSCSGSQFVFLCVALGDRDGARAAGRQLVVAPRRARVRRARSRCSPSSRRTSSRRTAIDDPALRGDRRARSSGARTPGTSRCGSRTSRARPPLPNAVTEGIGPSRRVVIWDTLLDGRFTPGEVRVVIAHELGHAKRNHILKSIAWYALFAFPVAYIISRVDRPARRDGRARGRSARAARRSSCSSCSRSAAPERDHAAHGGRGRLARAPDDPRPEGRRSSSSRRSCRPRSATRTRRRGSTCSPRTTRRSTSGSR